MHVSDPEFRVLHAVKLRSVAPKDWLESIVDGETSRLAPLADAGLLKERTGRIEGWSVTRDGRARHAELLEADKQAGNLAELLNPAYKRFLEVNQPFIDLCSAWQLRRDSGEPNDHTDPAYDFEITSELEEIHTVGDAVAEELAGIAERFQSYRPRFRHAIEQVRAGETDWFTKPTIDSYHTVWFELHEDLLVSQGIERASEGS